MKGLSKGKLVPSQKNEQTGKYNTTPTLLPFFSGKKMVEVACGGEFTFSLDKHGNCFSWGSNIHGQTLQDSSEPFYSSPQPLSLKDNPKIKKMSLGDFHTFLLLEDNGIYCGGLGENGQLGLGPLNQPEIKTPRKLSIPGHTIIAIRYLTSEIVFSLHFFAQK